MEAVKINEASTWTWEDGHDSIGSGWNEGVNESTWLRVYDLDGEPLKIRSMRMCLSVTTPSKFRTTVLQAASLTQVFTALVRCIFIQKLVIVWLSL
jgi:hypothetical protein